MTTHLYRAHIISQPEWEKRECFDTHRDDDRAGERYTVTDWCPVEWEASQGYIDRFGTDRWLEPAVDRAWRSRSSAAARRDILNAAGYIAIVQRSAPVVWPADGEKNIPKKDGVAQVMDALRVLDQHGIKHTFK